MFLIHRPKSVLIGRNCALGRYSRPKNEKSKDYCKADLKQGVLFFITIFRLAIPAFFRFTDVTELRPRTKTSGIVSPNMDLPAGE